MPLRAPGGRLAHRCASPTRALERCRPRGRREGQGRAQGTLPPVGGAWPALLITPPRPLKGAGRWRAACGYAVSQSQSQSPDDVLFPSPSDHQTAQHFVTGGQRRWPGQWGSGRGGGDSCPNLLAHSCLLQHQTSCGPSRAGKAEQSQSRVERARPNNLDKASRGFCSPGWHPSAP